MEYLYLYGHSYWAHANYEHSHLNQVCGMLAVPEDNMVSMIDLSSNGLFGPKQMEDNMSSMIYLLSNGLFGPKQM
jgi:hypothetical protein